jgi:hypothetical protein
VSEYHVEFERLVHGMLLYNDQYDDTFFMTRFMAGLKEEIRVAIALHRPRDVTTASVLAALQEDELSRCRSKPFGWDFTKTRFKPVADKGKGADEEKGKTNLNKSDQENKLATLRNYRCQNGICFKCGGKWDKTHKCPTQIPMHVLEELLDALEDDGNEMDYPKEELVEDVV